LAATPGIGERAVASIAVDLKDARESFHHGDGMIAAAACGIDVSHARRIGSAPGAVIACDRPELARRCATASGIEDGRRRFISEELALADAFDFGRMQRIDPRSSKAGIDAPR